MPRKTSQNPPPPANAGKSASMRPRPDAAENRSLDPEPPAPEAGFNEAAARCRGKPEIPGAVRIRVRRSLQ